MAEPMDDAAEIEFVEVLAVGMAEVTMRQGNQALALLSAPARRAFMSHYATRIIAWALSTYAPDEREAASSELAKAGLDLARAAAGKAEGR